MCVISFVALFAITYYWEYLSAKKKKQELSENEKKFDENAEKIVDATVGATEDFLKIAGIVALILIVIVLIFGGKRI